MSDVSTLTDKNDLTSGPIVKKLMLFFFPIVAGTLFQQLYNAVDAFVVSKFVGKIALAAVGGSPAVLSNLIIGFCTALSAGCAVVIAQFFGGGEKEKVSSAVKTSYVFCALLGIVLGGAVILFSPELLTILQTPEDTFSDALLYQRIYFAGSLFLLVFNMGSGILRAVGDSNFPFLCLFVGCGANIVLDLLFVVAFGWGVAGVAWATVIAEGISAVLVTVKLSATSECYKLDLFRVPFSGNILRRMLKIGIPSGIQCSTFGISNMILQVAINSLGSTATAAWALSGKVDGVYWATTNAFGTALTTFIGQNYGARKADRIKKATRDGLLVNLLMTAGIIAVLLSLGKMLLRFFTEDVGVQELTWVIMIYCVPAYLIYSVIEVYSGVLRGVGDTLIPSIILAVGICLSRIVWIYSAFDLNPSMETVCISYPLSWFITVVALLIYFFIKQRKNKLLQ